MQIAISKLTKIASELVSGGVAACSAASKLENNYYILLVTDILTNFVMGVKGEGSSTCNAHYSKVIKCRSPAANLEALANVSVETRTCQSDISF